jgi:hypothetical protein
LSRPLQWLLALFILAVLAVELWQNSVKWLFLCEVQWIALACLILLPILAWTIDRALVLGAYEIETWIDGFWLALLLAWAAASIIWTAQIELSLAETRLHEPIGSRIFPCAIGAIFLGLALLLNLVVTHLVSNAPRDDGKRELSWGAIDSGMLIGLIAGIVGFLIGEAVIWLVHLVLSSYLPPSLVEVVRAIQSWFQWLPPQLRDGYIGHSGNLATESSHVAAALLVVVHRRGLFRVPQTIVGAAVLPRIATHRVSLAAIRVRVFLPGFSDSNAFAALGLVMALSPASKS